MELLIGIFIGGLIFSNKRRSWHGVIHCKYPTYERPLRFDRK